MNQTVFPRPCIYRRFSAAIISAAIVITVIVSLSVLPWSAGAQSGRRTAPPASKPSPSPSSAEGASSDQDEQTATNGKLAGEGEEIEGDTLTVNTNLVTVP